MNISRKQLYALGEPFGESATRLKPGGRVYGGGGSSTPEKTTTVTDLPDWAKGYAKDTLAKTAAITDISKNPYQTYGGERIAGFQPMQQQSFESAQGLRPSDQLTMGTNLAGAAGLSALGTNYQGRNFQGGQFDNQAAQQYMNPYTQNVVDYQKSQALRDFQVAQPMRQAQAVQQGAFGGSRSAIVDAEAQRTLNSQLQGIEATGQQAAFQNAQQQFNADQARRLQAQQMGEQSRQYGAGLGMQGLQTALQSAGQLGQLGQTQYGQETGIIGLQNQLGTQQQQQAQRPLDMAYQDFVNQQNYPYKQLGFMSDMIRGLPLGQQSTGQVYAGSGNTMGQLAGIGMGAYGLSKMAADGGLMNSYADGGLTYADGGVTDPQNVESILSKLSDQQLQQAKEAALNRRDVNEAQMIDAEIAQRAAMRGANPQMPQGIAPAVTDQFADGMEQNMATGGIVAFADRGIVTEGEDYSHEGMRKPDSIKMPRAKSKAGIPDAVKQAVPVIAEKAGVPEEDIMARVPGLMDMFQKQYAPLIEQQRAMVEQSKPDTKAMKEQGLAQALTQFGFKMAANAARPGARFLESASAATSEISSAVLDMNKLMSAKQENYNKMKMEQAKYENALQIGNMKEATVLAGQLRQSQQTDKQIKMQQDQLAEQIRAHGVSESQTDRQLGIMAQNAATSAANKPETLQGLAALYMKNNPGMDFNTAMDKASKSRYGMSADIRSNTALLQAQEKAREAVDKLPKYVMLGLMSPSDPKYPALKAEYEQEIRARTQALMPQETGASSAAPASSSGTIMRFDSKGNPI